MKQRVPVKCLRVCNGRASVKLFSWAYVGQGVYFGAYGMPGVSILSIFVCQAFWSSA